MSIIQGNAKQGSTRGFYPKVINGSLRFNDDDSAYLSWTPASAGNQKTFTISFWLKMGLIPTSASMNIVGTGTNNTEDFMIGLSYDAGRSCRLMVISRQSSSVVAQVETSAQFRDPSAWYHFVISVDTTQATASNRIKIYVNGVHQTSLNIATYPSQNLDFRFNSANVHRIGTTRDDQTSTSMFDGYLAEVFFIDGQALTADDFGELKNGVWVAKDYAGTFGTNGFYLTFEDDTQVEAFNTTLWDGNGKSQEITGYGFSPDLVWIRRRDATAGLEVHDTVRGTGAGRLTTNSTSAESNVHTLTAYSSDGFTVDSSNNTYGGTNYNGNNYVGWAWDAGANNVVTGHSSVTYTGDGTDNMEVSGFPFSPDLLWIKERNGTEYHNFFDTVRGSNKILFSNVTNAEVTDDNRVTSFTSNGFKVGTDSATNTSGDTYVAWGWDAGDSDPVSNTAGSITSTVKTNGDFSIISYTGVGPASAANEIQVGHGLTSKPDFVIVKRRNSTGDWFVFTDIVDGSNDYLYLNQTAAKGDSGNSVPTDTVINLGGSLNTSGGTYVAYAWRNVTGKQKFGTYSGTGSDVTVNVGFRPGFLLVKWTGGGGASAENWAIVDASRDPINNLTKGLFPNTSGAEQDSALNNEVEFTSTGFVVKNTDARWNANGGTYIYAAFAGSYSDYITDYNTDGSIDSRVKANPTTGFSIATFTGASDNDSIGHGLGVAPDMVIFKKRSAVGDWWVYHSSLGANSAIRLNDTGAAYTGYNYWPTVDSTKIQFDGTSAVTGGDVVAYCWSETTGYSKFGSYTGGTTSNKITTGFKPALIIVKNTTNAFGWWMVDNTRDVDGTLTEFLFANASDAEGSSSSNRISVQSDGFTLLDTGNPTNASGSTYIYAAFADTREAAFWLDQSGNDNDWQPVNLDHNDTVADSPTDNFATWNPLAKLGSVALPTFSDGNLTLTTNASVDTMAVATMGITSGTFYYEATLRSANTYHQFGVASKTDSITTNTDRVTYFGFNGYIYNNATSTSGYGTNSAGDVLGVACDADAGTVKFYLNNTLLSTESWTSNTGLYIPFMAGSNGTYTADVNFGQQPFKYNPPE